MRERYIIDSNMAVITWETLNPAPRNSSERYSYFVEYRDTADQLRESEILNGFFSPDHCVQDALANIDCLDLTPKPEPEPNGPRFTEKYHIHICKQSCGLHRCVNPACEMQGEFVARRVAEIICPACGAQTGNQDFFSRQQLITSELIPAVEQPTAA
jgi:hypothetical protein